MAFIVKESRKMLFIWKKLLICQQIIFDFYQGVMETGPASARGSKNKTRGKMIDAKEKEKKDAQREINQ